MTEHGGTPGKPPRMPPGDDPRAGRPIPSLYASPRMPRWVPIFLTVAVIAAVIGEWLVLR